MVPKDRDGEFQTELFERYQRSEKELWTVNFWHNKDDYKVKTTASTRFAPR